MELNKENIIKALECCLVETNCTGCPLNHQYETDCLKYAGVKALSLIKELTEENERLKWQNAHLECVGEVAVKNRDECEQQLHYLSNVEIPYLYEALEGKGKDADKLLDILLNALEKAKAVTVRKMQEMLKAKAIGFPNYTGEVIAARWVDQIAKEMLDGDE